MKFQLATLFSISIFLVLSTIDKNSMFYRNHKLRGIYCSFSSASWFLYDFIDDSTFEFKTEGHFGRTKTKGSYIINQDTIQLTPFSKERQPDSLYFKKMGNLVIKNDSCLVSSSNEAHCKITPEGWCYPGD